MYYRITVCDKSLGRQVQLDHDQSTFEKLHAGGLPENPKE